MTSTSRCRGQAVILLLAVVVMAALAVVAVGQFAARIVDRGRAQTAADAAALAGTTGGQRAAGQLAADNGGHLLSYRQRGDEVTVVVEVRGQRATARATDGP
jgi:outer membrane lipoprotein SlyB